MVTNLNLMNSTQTNDDLNANLSTDQIISLMGVYLNEWSCREASLWKQVFVYFYSTLIVMILPYIEPLGFGEQKIINPIFFTICGIIMAIMFWIVAFAYAIRLKRVGDTYADLMKFLPEDFRRKAVAEKEGNRNIFYKIMNMSMAYLIINCMLILLLTIGVLLLFLNMR